MNGVKTKKDSYLKKIFRKLYPTYVFDGVEHIPINLLNEEKIKLILIDMDNTLISKNQGYTRAIKKWISNVKNSGIKIYIFSNSLTEKRVKEVADKLNIKYKYNVTKPLKRAYEEFFRNINMDRENIIMIGDQIFTDVWGGNRVGIKTILVKPIAKKESIHTRLKRPFEKIVMKKYMKKKGGKKC